MNRTAVTPLSCAACHGRIDPGDEYRVVAGANYHPGDAPTPTVARPWVATGADLASSRWGGGAA